MYYCYNMINVKILLETSVSQYSYQYSVILNIIRELIAPPSFKFIILILMNIRKLT